MILFARLSSLLVVVSLTCCGSPGSGVPDASGDGAALLDAGAVDSPDASSVVDAGEAFDAGSGVDAGPPVVDAGPEPVDAGSTVDAGSPPVDAGTPEITVTRFVALGDTGKDNEAQMAVANAMKATCTARGGCQFGLLLGDNFYPTGVQSADDALFDSMFAKQYGQLGFPFFPTLGNHDYGGNGAGYEVWKGQFEVDYSARNPQWVMPAKFHHFAQPFVDFYNLDTNTIFLLSATEQRDFLRTELPAATQPWKIAYGHHMYVSNGPHGNAGRYDMVPSNGNSMKSFVENELCGKVDIYLCGHDHDMQDLGTICGTKFLVSGAGATVTKFRDAIPFLYEPNVTEFQNDSVEGFTLFEVTATTLTYTFFDKNGAQLHTRMMTK